MLVGLRFQNLTDRSPDAFLQTLLCSDCEPVAVYPKLAFSSTSPAAHRSKHVLINLGEFLESYQHFPLVISVIFLLVE